MLKRLILNFMKILCYANIMFPTNFVLVLISMYLFTYSSDMFSYFRTDDMDMGIIEC